MPFFKGEGMIGAEEKSDDWLSLAVFFFCIEMRGSCYVFNLHFPDPEKQRYFLLLLFFFI